MVYIKRKLLQEDERQVELAYLCGIDTITIGKKYNISDATIRTNIHGKRSYQWNDPLVEFYRQTDSRNREKNSVHLYLAFATERKLRKTDGDFALPNKELVDLARCIRSVYEFVDEAVYQPKLDALVKRTALSEYLASRNPYEKLLRVILGRYTHEEDVTKQFLMPELLAEYPNWGRFSFDKAFGKTAVNIIEKIKYGGAAITPLKRKVIDDVLGTLLGRERKILALRLGLEEGNGKGMTLEKVAELQGITKERTRQIEAKALRKLRHPSKARKLQILEGLVSDEEIEESLKEIKYNEERARWKNILYSEIESEIRDGHGKSKIFNKPLEEIEFSVRTANCLDNAGVKTVGELTAKTESELLKTKNMGRKSIKEIRTVLEDIGLSLRK